MSKILSWEWKIYLGQIQIRPNRLKIKKFPGILAICNFCDGFLGIRAEAKIWNVINSVMRMENISRTSTKSARIVLTFQKSPAILTIGDFSWQFSSLSVEGAKTWENVKNSVTSWVNSDRSRYEARERSAVFAARDLNRKFQPVYSGNASPAIRTFGEMSYFRNVLLFATVFSSLCVPRKQIRRDMCKIQKLSENFR